MPLLLIVGGLICGCAHLPANLLLSQKGDNAAMKAVMKRNDSIIQLSSKESGGNRPVLLLLHGATDDPTEMMDIVRDWRGKYDVFLYSYNYHRRIQRVAADFVQQVKQLKSDIGSGRGITIVVFSYGAVVFREAVVDADDRTLFSNVTLIQLAPTAGGSYLARGLKNSVTAWLVFLVSRPTHAEDPYSGLANRMWAGEGNQRFYRAIAPARMHTILLEGDPHSLANVSDSRIREHYCNGIGFNVVVIPKSTGATHDYLPTNPAALEYLRKLLEPTRNYAGQNGMQTTARKRWAQ